MADVTRHGSITLRKFQLKYNYLSNLLITITTSNMYWRRASIQDGQASTSA